VEIRQDSLRGIQPASLQLEDSTTGSGRLGPKAGSSVSRRGSPVLDHGPGHPSLGATRGLLSRCGPGPREGTSRVPNSPRSGSECYPAGLDITGGRIEFAVEYERTLKSQAKYEKIREVIESEKRLNVFLYLLPSYELLSSLQHEFWLTKRQVLFGLADEFKENVFQAPLTTPMYERTSLQDTLIKARALAKPPK
jgi:hypothetical protein